MYFITFASICLIAVVAAVEVDLTIEVLPARRECLFQTISEGASVDVEYQVIDGGDLDVNFVIKNPQGQVMATDVRKTASFHKFKAPLAGDYEFCIDNSFSRFSDKVVFFELMTDEPDERQEAIKNLQFDMETDYEMKIEDFRDYIFDIDDNMENVEYFFKYRRATEMKDAHLMNSNLQRVNFLSLIHLLVLIVTAVLQVVTIRRLFKTEDPKPKQLNRM